MQTVNHATALSATTSPGNLPRLQKQIVNDRSFGRVRLPVTIYRDM